MLNRTTARVVVAIGLATAGGGGLALAMGASVPGIAALAGGGLFALMFLQVALGDGKARVPGAVQIKEHALVLTFADRTETFAWSEVTGVTLQRFGGAPAAFTIRTQRGAWTIPMQSVRPEVAGALELEMKLRLPA